ncbi:MAG: Holliday junction resolvase RuvX [Chthonomonas sp.]|nr:Holliday junction resolvase RuvX [Chthonomonas sp.]
MRVLGVDWGGARIGIAVGESEFGIASPRQLITATGTLAKDAVLIKDQMVKEKATLAVVGVPYHETNDRQARVCLQFVERLRELNVEVVTVDESLTSAQSNQDMIDQGMKAAERRQKVDSESAVRILLRFFNEHGG